MLPAPPDGVSALFDDMLATALCRRCFALTTGPENNWPEKLQAHRPLVYSGDHRPFCTAVQVRPYQHASQGWITPQNTPRSTRPAQAQQPMHAVRVNPDAAAHVWTVSASQPTDCAATLVVLDTQCLEI